MWSIDGWEKKKSRFIQAPASRASPLVGDTKVQFHNDQTHFLVVHESQLAIYDSKLECLCLVSSSKYAVLYFPTGIDRKLSHKSDSTSTSSIVSYLNWMVLVSLAL